MLHPIEHPSCSICFEHYSDKVVPRTLPACGHTYCEMCIKQFKNGLNIGRVKCPFDSKISVCLDVQSLQKNFEVIRIVEEIKERRRKEGRSTPEILVTTPCHEVSAHVAQLHCKDCRADLCKECSEKIHKIKLFHGHTPVQLSVVAKRELNCPVHRSWKANLICTQYPCSASYPIGCDTCFQFGEHSDHFKEERVPQVPLYLPGKKAIECVPTPPERSMSLPSPPSISLPSSPRESAEEDSQGTSDDSEEASSEDSQTDSDDSEEVSAEVALPRRTVRLKNSIRNRFLKLFRRAA